MSTLHNYYQLTKPGIIYGNLISAVAGFLLASRWHISLLHLGETLASIALIIASACVFNNIIDRDIDAKMPRTKKRAMVQKTIPIKNALIFGTILGILGFAFLLKFTNLITSTIGAIAYVDYIVFYAIGKRKSVYGTIIGSISGAMPIVAGYTSVTGRFDIAALLLFIILVVWQMPHFYAIATYRFDDYQNAGLPVLPVKEGVARAKIHIVVYIAIFIVATALLTVYKFTGLVYLAIVLVAGLSWLIYAVMGFYTLDTKRWARKMFFASLIVLLVFSVMISVNVV